MEQRNAIVTGGLRGLGRAMALGLARDRCQVLAVGHIEADVARLLARLPGRRWLAACTRSLPICATPRNATAWLLRRRIGSAGLTSWSTMPG